MNDDNAQRGCAIIYDADDLAAIQADPPPVDRYVCLCPDVAQALEGGPVRVVRLGEILTDRHHRWVVARLRRARREMETAASRSSLGVAAQETLLHDVQVIGTVALRFHCLLDEGGPWYVQREQKWHRAETRKDALRLIIDCFQFRYPAYRDMVVPVPLPALARFLNRVAARCLSNKVCVFLTARLYGIRAITDHAGGSKVNWVEVRGSRGSRYDWLRPLYSIYSMIVGKTKLTLIVVPLEAPEKESVAGEVLSAVSDPVINAILAHVAGDLRRQAAYTESLCDEVRRLCQLAKPKSVLAHTLRWSDEAALGQGAGEAGVWRLLATHGSHAKQDDPFSEETVKVHARGMLYSALADATLVQSPYAAEALKSWMPKMAQIPSQPIIWGNKKSQETDGKARQRRILHAGTYKWLMGPRGYMYETSDEYIQGIITLAEAVSKLESTELVIRVRPKVECAIDTLRANLPPQGNWRIQTDGEFLDDLMTSDVLVSYSSTTLEEALNCRRPVVLWGGADRYRHLRPSSRPPRGEDRAAIYAANSSEQLPILLDAVLRAHAGQPLTDLEIDRHVHRDGLETDGLIDLLVSGGDTKLVPSMTVDRAHG